MCGRFTLGVTMEELMLHYMLDDIPDYIDYNPRYNIAPTQQVVAIIHDGTKRRAGTLRWGLIPHWAKDKSIGSKMINARSETLLDKPAFREPFLRKRCLIPADGFYEWQKQENGTKTPYRITMQDKGIFSFAGLYDIWMSPEGQRISTCTILTTRPNSLMSQVHDRMPVMIHPEQEELWLDRTVQRPEAITPLLVPYPAEQMQAYPVSTAVGKVTNDSIDLIAPVKL
ncbi:SOS response-associated peptidase [Paenibacillus sp. Marseille-Q4541]|uniref:SOS response-associated peptidase n=1 Tax=Paenibacillus sp. Marseille-Q4541 TaxID=2831522 RepID=UPI001BA8AE6C|nr:SOS response-associated peptidase [Paenibacillus sp. Marseille-Q4541]